MGSGFSRKTSYRKIPSISEEEKESIMTGNERYRDVPSDDEEEDTFDDEMPTQRRRHRPPPPNTSNSIVQGVWVCLAVVLVLAFGAVLGWKEWVYDKKLKLPMYPAHDTVHQNSDDYGSGDMLDPSEIDDSDETKKAKGVKQDTKIVVPTSNLASVHYDPSAALHAYNPFDLQEVDSYGSVLIPPSLPFDDEMDEDDLPLGYLQHPSVVNGTLVFTSEGDMYLSQINDSSRNSLPAMKLTSTVGNVLTPTINPVYPYWVAFTATYTGRREVYLMDLRPSRRHTPALRLTYWSGYGVRHIVGWKDDGQTLVFTAASNEVSLPDVRMYQLALVQEGAGSNDNERKKGRERRHLSPHWPVRVLQILPVPLSQAIEGAYDQTSTCLYFTRFSQSSNTARYVGGTAESLWAYCHNEVLAVPLTKDYKGTSKSSQVMKLKGGEEYLLFLSDRIQQDGKWVPSTMNLWAMALPSQSDLYLNAGPPILSEPVQLTQVSCEFNGMHLREYALDPVTNNVVVRIGADMHLLKSESIKQILQSRRKLDEDDDDEVDSDDNSESEGEDDDDDDSGDDDATDTNEEKPIAQKSVPTEKEINNASSPKVEESIADENISKVVSSPKAIKRLPIVVYSDFNQHHERLIPISVTSDLNEVDIYETPYETVSALLSLRGQVYVAPLISDVENEKPYAGPGMNLPPRRYRVAPGSTTGGVVRILKASHVPLRQEAETSTRRLALFLGTDPLSGTAEHAFYLVETQADSAPSFVDASDFPEPFLGGNFNGASVANGGLGSVNPSNVKVSPCGRRLVWSDTDGRICVMTLPLYQNATDQPTKYTVLPEQNEEGEPMVGTDVELSWSPGGRYLAITHQARNQFQIISIADLGSPEQAESLDVADIELGRIVQATPDRFNSGDAYWGRTAHDIKMANLVSMEAKLLGTQDWSKEATTLYFLSDRDVVTDVSSPWGTRAPSPHFPKIFSLYALPLTGPMESSLDSMKGTFSGGGASELSADRILQIGELVDSLVSSSTDTERHLLQKTEDSLAGRVRKMDEIEESAALSAETNEPLQKLSASPSVTSSSTPSLSTQGPSMHASSVPSSAPSSTPMPESPFPKDGEIDFGFGGLDFSRRAYRVANVPPGEYVGIVSQAVDDPSFVFMERDADSKIQLKIFAFEDFPSSAITPVPITFAGKILQGAGVSTTREYIYVVYSGEVKVLPNSVKGITSLKSDAKYTQNIVDTGALAISVWPALEYHQMYNDAWRMLRDYFYDKDMTGINWPDVHARYLPLVKRCVKREDLNDVLEQMAAELSALHVFVHDGEYASPIHDSKLLAFVNDVASLGATFERSAEWKGYVVTSIPERDPDFNLKDGNPIYSPLSDRVLRMSGQRGLQVGDVVVGINGESVMRVPDLNMLLRGMAGQSVRLAVLRLASNSTTRRALEKNALEDDDVLIPEPVIAVPIPSSGVGELLYDAWEWKTKEMAQAMAKEKGFSVGYLHLKSMGKDDADAFVRGFYPDYNKEALIVDVRHNRGGNIDSWLLDALQRKAWMYWQSRTRNITTGGLGWDEHFAFRGHLVVLIDSHTSSDGEGFSRGVSELGLGKLIGTRTWGGGIWLSSDNKMVDGGIATAPEVGTYNANFGWGLGIENLGVEPDIEVDNNPRLAYDGKDEMLEKAIDHLAQWLKDEPVVFPSPPDRKDNSLHAEGCSAK